MKTKILLLAIILFALASCKKNPNNYDTSDLYPAGGEKIATSSALKVFYDSKAYFVLYMYRFEPTTSTWGRVVSNNYVTLPPNDSITIGITNPYVNNSGTGFLDMNNLYSAEIGSTNVVTAKMNVPRFLQFFPITSGATRGIARVIKQDVTVTRSNGTTFKIGISGEGSYDETTKVIDLVVDFDDSSINGTGKRYQYKYSVNKLTL